MMVFHIAARELRGLFLSPLAWTILAVVQLILAYFFLVNIDRYVEFQPRLALMEEAPGLTDIIVAPLFGVASFVLLFTVPMLTMRLISEERRNQTLSLLFSAPVSMSEIVIGKYLGVTSFLLIMVTLVGMMPLSLLGGGTLDYGLYLSGLLGLFLLVASFAALGLFMSTLTAYPVVAAIGTFGMLLLLWVLDWAGPVQEGESSGALAYISILRHYEPLLKGVFNTSDVIYYLLFIGACLILSVRRLDADRLQH